MQTLPDCTKIVIIEDEKDAAYLLRKLLFDLSFNDINVYNDAESGMEAIRTLKPAVIFLDVQLQGNHNGINVLKYIEAIKIHTHVIITTGYPEHLSEIIRYSPIDLLLKPIGTEELVQALRKVARHIFMHIPADLKKKNGNSAELIEINSNQEVRYYQAKNVIYVEADGSYTNIYLAGRKKDTISQNLGKIITQFPENRFKRISRKHVVNTDFFKLLNKKTKELLLDAEGEIVKLNASSKYMSKKYLE